jgi:hypothetical protein
MSFLVEAQSPNFWMALHWKLGPFKPAKKKIHALDVMER